MERNLQQRQQEIKAYFVERRNAHGIVLQPLDQGTIAPAHLEGLLLVVLEDYQVAQEDFESITTQYDFQPLHQLLELAKKMSQDPTQYIVLATLLHVEVTKTSWLYASMPLIVGHVARRYCKVGLPRATTARPRRSQALLADDPLMQTLDQNRRRTRAAIELQWESAGAPPSQRTRRDPSAQGTRGTAPLGPPPLARPPEMQRHPRFEELFAEARDRWNLPMGRGGYGDPTDILRAYSSLFPRNGPVPVDPRAIRHQLSHRRQHKRPRPPELLETEARTFRQ